MGRRVRKFDGAFSPKGCGLPWGHFVARVHRVQRGRLTGLRPEGCVEGLHRFAQGATAPTALKVADCPSGNAYKASVTGFAFLCHMA